MQRTPVKSSQITSIGYDGEKAILEVEFARTPIDESLKAEAAEGAVYQYEGVEPAVYQALIEAESIGKQFNLTIRNQYPYIRKAEDAPEAGVA